VDDCGGRTMRRAVLICGLLVLAGLAAGFRSTRDGEPSAASVTQAMDKVYAAYERELVGMCAGAVDGPVAVAKCYGRRVRGGTARPNPNTLFLIDSVTKTFTATLLAIRVEQHSIPSLDTKVKPYWPSGDDRADVPDALTFADLAQHYSGLPGGQTPPASGLDAYLRSAAGALKQASCWSRKKGCGYLYSNRGFGVLGTLLALHDGRADGTLGPWAPDNASAVTGPLGMTSTKTWLEWQASNPLYYESHRAIAHGTDHWAGQPYGDPAGALYSSARDMLTWLRYSMGLAGSTELVAAHHWLFDYVKLRPENHKIMKTGLAWTVDARTGTPCVEKDGGGLGFSAFVLFAEHQRRGVFVLLNNSPATDIGVIARALVNGLPTTPGAGSLTC